MSTYFIVFSLFLLVLVAWLVRDGVSLPKPFSSRSCQGKSWRSAFPLAEKQEIRSFLSLFVDAFVFRESQKLKLHPNDSILSIYRALYPYKWMPDALEFEELAISIEKVYSVKLIEVWEESLTLGELFAAVQVNR